MTPEEYIKAYTRGCSNELTYGGYPYAQPYRNPDNPNEAIPQWQKDMAGWCNKKMIFQMCDFKEFSPRKDFICASYFQ